MPSFSTGRCVLFVCVYVFVSIEKVNTDVTPRGRVVEAGCRLWSPQN